MRRSPGSAISRMPCPQEFRHSSATPTASSPCFSSRDSDSDWIGARQSGVDGGVLVEQTLQVALDQRAECVAGQSGFVEEVLP